MVEARGMERSMIGVDQGCKHGEGSSKTVHVVIASKEERDHATITKASINVSAILLIVLVWCSSRKYLLKS